MSPPIILRSDIALVTDLPEPPELVCASVGFPLYDSGTCESCSGVDIKKFSTLSVDDGDCPAPLVGQMPGSDRVLSKSFLLRRRAIVVRRRANP